MKISDEGSQFWNRAIHDIRSALRRISISAECAQLGLDHSDQPDSIRASIRGVREGADVMGRILTAISDYSASATVSYYSFQTVTSDQVLQDALTTLRGRVQDTGAKITHGPMPKVTGDHDKLAQVFVLLIENAILYAGNRVPEVEVRGTEEAGLVTFCVSDRGIGIPAAYEARLFTPFYRLHGAEIPGVGLGLATCRQIVELHGGRIWFRSEPGSTDFLFTIPAAATSPNGVGQELPARP
ncbi:MAG TPA: ATP-binding protein [Bryobacteraceae bacterium]|nr:ATP-binding protein [Bryobacteraceae bacterium]